VTQGIPKKHLTTFEDNFARAQRLKDQRAVVEHNLRVGRAIQSSRLAQKARRNPK
jgi:hypothetical protein